ALVHDEFQAGDDIAHETGAIAFEDFGDDVVALVGDAAIFALTGSTGAADDAGDVSAVPVVVYIAFAGEVFGRFDSSGEVGMGGVNAGVYDADDDALAGKTLLPDLGNLKQGNGDIEEGVHRLVEPNHFDVGTRGKDFDGVGRRGHGGTGEEGGVDVADGG